MVIRPEDIYAALSEAYNAGDLEALVSLYDPKAVFVIKPGRVTKGPAELHGALQHLITLRGHLTVNPRTFIATDELKQFPAYLNRWDSQQARNEGVFAH
jgi:hypothetical protein